MGATFKGFEKPEQNYSRLPHSFIDVLPQIDTMAEMKVVLYLLRHTWGFSEFGKPKKLTTDEFCSGRKKKDQSRMDNGTGLSENSVRSGLEKAIEHGFILVETDETDKARIEKWYCLNMEDTSEFAPRGAKFEGLGAEFEDRSEKETIERKEQSDSLPARQGTAYNRGEQEKPNAVDEYLRLVNAPGMKRETRIDAILSYLGERFHVNTEVKKWKEFAKFVETRQTHHGEQVDVFVSWLLGQKDFNLQYWPPSKMQEFWPMAFVKGDVNPQRAEGVSSGYFA